MPRPDQAGHRITGYERLPEGQTLQTRGAQNGCVRLFPRKDQLRSVKRSSVSTARRGVRDCRLSTVFGGA